jgi:hypothetical protein
MFTAWKARLGKTVTMMLHKVGTVHPFVLINTNAKTHSWFARLAELGKTAL